jgi:hypothetical protein
MQLSLVSRDLGIGLVSARCLREFAQRRKLRLIESSRTRASLEVVVIRPRFLGCLGAAVDAIEEEFALRYIRRPQP